MTRTSLNIALLRSFCLILAVTIAVISSWSAGRAQESPTAAAPQLDRPALEQLVETLEEPQARDAFIAQLKALVEAKESVAGPAQPAPPEGLGGRLLADLSARIDKVAVQLSEATQALLNLPVVLLDLWSQSRDPETLARWAEIVGKIAVVLLIGLAAAWMAARLLARPRRRIEEAPREAFLLRLVKLVFRTVLDLLPTVAFALAAYLVLPLTEPRPATRLVMLALINAHILVQVVVAVVRMFVAPRAPNLRLFAFGNEAASYIYIWARRLASLGIYGYFFSEAGLLLGLPPGAHALGLKIVGLLLAAMTVVLVLQNRVQVRDWIRGPQGRPGGEDLDESRQGTVRAIAGWIASVWHVVTVGLILALYGTWAFEVPGGFNFLIRGIVLTTIVGVIAWGLGQSIDAAVRRGSRIPLDLGQRFPMLEGRVNRYLPILRSVLIGLIYGVAALFVLEFWGVGTLDWVTTGAGGTAITQLVTILVLAGAFLIVWEIASALIESALDRQAAEEGGLQSARMLTLLPLCRNILRVVLVVMFTLIALSELGLDIGPLLAGAGVVGLAVGFGAQALVKDVITGAFMLVENSLAVGDWVDLGSHSGTVEAMTIRTVTLRDLQGTVHVIPFGEISSVLNYNRDFGFSVIDIGVAYREDVDEVAQVLEAIGQDMQADETFGPSILEPLKVMGLQNLSESSVDIRVRLKTKAMMQWSIRREFLRRVKMVFDERGIEIPFPHRTLYFGVDKAGAAPPMRMVQEAVK